MLPLRFISAGPLFLPRAPGTKPDSFWPRRRRTEEQTKRTGKGGIGERVGGARGEWESGEERDERRGRRWKR